MKLFHLKPLRHQTDEQLMAQAAAKCSPSPTGEGRGEAYTAFEELYRRYARRLKGFFFMQLGGDEELAADATHDVFLRAYEARSRYREGSNVGTWLFTIAYNICKNHYRSNAYEAELLASLDAEPVSEQQIEVEMDAAQLDEALERVLSELPPPLHQIFSLHYQEELTVPQVAEIVGIPDGTVKSRLHKTMNIIRKKLKGYKVKS